MKRMVKQSEEVGGEVRDKLFEELRGQQVQTPWGRIVEHLDKTVSQSLFLGVLTSVLTSESSKYVKIKYKLSRNRIDRSGERSKSNQRKVIPGRNFWNLFLIIFFNGEFNM